MMDDSLLKGPQEAVHSPCMMSWETWPSRGPHRPCGRLNFPKLTHKVPSSHVQANDPSRRTIPSTSGDSELVPQLSALCEKLAGRRTRGPNSEGQSGRLATLIFHWHKDYI